MNTIGLYGGSFDPVHNGHLRIAHAFADELGLQSVVFLPAGDPYHKPGSGTPAAHRLAMVERAIAGDPRFAASDCDIVRQGATYTIDTIQIFRQHFPKAQFWWLLGMDSLMQLHTWKNWQTLVRQVHIAAAERPGQTLAAAPKALYGWLGSALADGSLKILSTPPLDISSSRIRQLIAEDSDVSALLPESVADYVRKHRLYRL